MTTNDDPSWAFPRSRDRSTQKEIDCGIVDPDEALKSWAVNALPVMNDTAMELKDIHFYDSHDEEKIAALYDALARLICQGYKIINHREPS